MSSPNQERGEKRRKYDRMAPSMPVMSEAGGPSQEDLNGAEQERWYAIQARLREQAELFRAAETVRETVEVMLQMEVEEGTHEGDEPMSRGELDRRKIRIKDWLGHLVRLELAAKNAELAQAKFNLNKQKADGGAVQVTPEVLLDHQALVNWLRKRPDLFDEFQGERDAIGQ